MFSAPDDFQTPQYVVPSWYDNDQQKYVATSTTASFPVTVVSQQGPGASPNTPLYVCPVLYNIASDNFAMQAAAGVTSFGPANSRRMAAAANVNYMNVARGAIGAPLLADGAFYPQVGVLGGSSGTAYGAAPVNLKPAASNATAVQELNDSEQVCVVGNNAKGALTVSDTVNPDFSKVVGVASHSLASTNPQAIPSGGNYPELVMEQVMHVNTADPKNGYAKVVQIAQTTNTYQYMPTAGHTDDKTWAVRTNAAADGVSQQLCMTNLDATEVNVVNEDPIKVAQFSEDGKTAVSVSASGNVGADSTLVASNVVQTIAQQSGTIGITRCQIVDGTNTAVSVVNGVLSTTLADTNSHPLQVNVHGAGTSATYVLAVEAPAAAGPALAVSVNRDFGAEMLQWVKVMKEKFPRGGTDEKGDLYRRLLDGVQTQLACGQDKKGYELLVQLYKWWPYDKKVYDDVSERLKGMQALESRSSV
jgi:hypothetical protein